MLQTLTHIVTRQILSNELRLQRKLGYRLTFNNLPADWLNGYAVVDLTPTWHSYGLPIRGLNYFTFGAVTHGLSSRFLSSSDLYQAWLGGYIFESSKRLNWQPKDYVKLAEADQEGWLHRFGDAAPNMDFGNVKKINDLKISGKDAQLFSWSGTTESDVGPSHSIIFKAMMRGLAEIINASNPQLKLGAKSLIPKRKTQPYEEIAISGYMIIINLAPRRRAVLYVCMVGDNEPDRKTMKQLITRHVSLEKI